MRSESLKGNKNGLTHGGCGTKEYIQWENMKASCNNLNHKQYKNYGAKGITVCERWCKSFSDFLSDMGHKPSPQHVFRRKENKGNFEPDNCHWTMEIVGGINSKGQRIKGVASWNKGIPCYHGFKKGHIPTSKVRFKKGDVIIGWKSDRNDRYAIHYWIKKMKGRPTKCEICGKESDNAFDFQWANKTGEYKMELDDWLRLCRKCHHKYDRTPKK